ncbi:MAG: hypothetical protein KDK66_03450 [Deltaproteobacteria bacterium]|nr:hypothetical protein [Deltaproteobacteria bacterium]
MKQVLNKQCFFLMLLISLFACSGGTGTEAVNPPSPLEPIAITQPCSEIGVPLLEGWAFEFLERGTDLEQQLQKNNPEVPTILMAYLKETDLETEINIAYFILDSNLMTFKDFVYSAFDESAYPYLVFLEDGLMDEQTGYPVYGGGLAARNSEDHGQVFLSLASGVEDPSQSIIHIIWLFGIIDGEGETEEIRFEDAQRKYSEELKFILDGVEIRPKTCDLKKL